MACAKRKFQTKIDLSKTKIDQWGTNLRAEAGQTQPETFIEYKELWMAYSHAVLALCELYKNSFLKLDSERNTGSEGHDALRLS